MKKFNIYENRLFGKVEAVKDGFSWPGFFFGMFWLAYKKMWQWFAIYLVLVLFIIPMITYSLSAEYAFALQFILGIAISAVLGFKGNSLYEKHLMKKRYEKIAEVLAESKDDAIIKLRGGETQFIRFRTNIS